MTGGYYGEVSAAQAAETLEHYLNRGGRWIDTADLYGNGENECLVGRVVAGRREDVVISTKFGYLFGERAEQRGVEARTERVAKAREASLKRLSGHVIDME